MTASDDWLARRGSRSSLASSRATQPECSDKDPCPGLEAGGVHRPGEPGQRPRPRPRRSHPASATSWALRRPGRTGPPMRRKTLADPVVDHAEQPAFLIAAPPLLDHAGGHREPGRGQLAGLGLLPAGQRDRRRIIFRPRQGARLSVWRNPAQHLDDMPLPPQHPRDRVLRQGTSFSSAASGTGARRRVSSSVNPSADTSSDTAMPMTWPSRSDRRITVPETATIVRARPANSTRVADTELARPLDGPHREPPEPGQTRALAVGRTARSAART